MISRRALFPVVAAVALIVGCESKPVEKIPTTAPTAIKAPHEVLQHLQYIAVRKDLKDLPVVAPTDSETAKGAAWWFTSHSGDMGIALNDDEIKTFELGDLKAKGLVGTVSRKALASKIDEINTKMQEPGAPKPKAKKGVDPVQELLPPEMKGLDPNKLDFPQSAPKDVYEKEIKPAVDKYLRPLYNAGLYRLLKGVPTEMWGDIAVNQVKPNASGNAKLQDVFLAYKGTVIIQVTVVQNDNGTWGVSYIKFSKYPRALEIMLKKAQAGQ